MNEIIEISNFLLINYWWIILPICTLGGFVLFSISESIFNNEVINTNLIESDMKWDKYGNPVFEEDVNDKI